MSSIFNLVQFKRSTLLLCILFLYCYKPSYVLSEGVTVNLGANYKPSISKPVELLVEPPIVNNKVMSSRSGLNLGRVVRGSIYDVSIKKWNNVYTPHLPWCWNKAQIRAESAFIPTAISPVGAKGLGQFMPLTWKQMQTELGHNESVFSPSYNIQAQAYYMYKLRGQFKKPRPEYDRHSLALASYNAGLGNILKAQKLGGNSLMYNPMINQLHRVTGHHAKETSSYVSKIWLYVREYEKEGLCD